MTLHGHTRSCTKCGAELWWNADRNVWEGEHNEGCAVGPKIERAAMPAHVRGPRHDETDFIGPNGQQEWRVTLQNGAGVPFEEVLAVYAATEDGAILLAQESRLNIAGILAEPYEDGRGQ